MNETRDFDLSCRNVKDDAELLWSILSSNPAHRLKDAAGLIVLEAGLQGNLHARRMLIQAWDEGFLGDSVAKTAKDWLVEAAKAMDRRATLVIGRHLLASTAVEKRQSGRSCLMRAAFDAELVDEPWISKIDIRQAALRALVEYHSVAAAGPAPNQRQALYYLDLAITLGQKGALVAKAQELLAGSSDKKEIEALECLERYWNGIGSPQKLDDLPPGYLLPEVLEAETLLDSLEHYRTKQKPNSEA